MAEAINQELTIYTEEITDDIKTSARRNMAAMVKETKAQRFKQDTGDYRKAIASRKLIETPNQLIMQWYVKAPHYRLSHLLERGHATRSGGRTIAYNFISKAEQAAVKQFTKDVEEAVKK